MNSDGFALDSESSAHILLYIVLNKFVTCTNIFSIDLVCPLCVFMVMLYYFVSRVLSVVSSQQTGLRGALQDF